MTKPPELVGFNDAEKLSIVFLLDVIVQDSLHFPL